MKKNFFGVYSFLILIFCTLCLLGFQKRVLAKVDWAVLENITLNDTPQDIAISNDGATAYILGVKNILIYNIQEKKVVDTIPITGKHTQIAISTSGEKLFLTDQESKQLTIIEVSEVFNIEIASSPIIGNKDAPVTLVAFLDFQCPYCSRVYPIIEQLLDKYPKDVKLIIKHYPLRMHKFAKKSSIASLAAARQDKYKEMAKILLSNYKNLNDQTITKYAQDAGLDMQKFNGSLNDPALLKIVNQDMKLGGKVKVKGVPALFINGLRVKSRSLQALSNMVEKELNKAKK